MKKLKNEAQLVKEALRVGAIYAEKRGAAKFEPSDSMSLRIEYLYKLLVHDKLIQPMPPDQISEKTMRHKLALWIARQLPEDHPLVQ